MASICIVIGGDAVVRVVRVVVRGVETNLDPSEETVVQVVAKVNVLGERIVRAIGLLDRPHVLSVGRNRLSIGVIGVGVLHCGSENLVPEQLSDLSHAARAHFQGFVWENSRVEVSQQMSVRSTAFVVTGEDCLEVHNAVLVGLLNTAKVSAVPSAGSIVAGLRNSTSLVSTRVEPYVADVCIPVDTSGIGLPNIDQSTRNGSAGVDVNVLHLQRDVHTVRVQILLHVLTDHFAPDVVRAVGNGGGKNAAGVGGKHDRLGGGRAIVKDTGLVVVDSLPLLESSQITTPFLGV